MFELTHINETTHLRIHVRGELTSATAPQFDTALAALLAGGANRWLLDLSELTFTSSAGLRVFLGYAKKIKNAQGRLALCSLQPAVSEVFTMSGFTQIFSIAPGPAEGRLLFASS